MTKTEYSEAMYAAKQLLHKTEQQLMKEYAEAQNPYKIGDLFRDRLGTIKIEKIKFTGDRVYPSCIYYGTMHTKAGQPHKSGTTRNAYQTNEVK